MTVPFAGGGAESVALRRRMFVVGNPEVPVGGGQGDDFCVVGVQGCEEGVEISGEGVVVEVDGGVGDGGAEDGGIQY